MNALEDDGILSVLLKGAALTGMDQGRTAPFHAMGAFMMDTALPDANTVGEVLQMHDLLVPQRIAR